MNEATTSAAAPVARLIDEFHKLPGIGPKSAQRLTYYLLRAPADDARALAQAILEVKDKIVLHHGSLLIMPYSLNQDWQHSVPTRKRITTARYNLTFRFI